MQQSYALSWKRFDCLILSDVQCPFPSNQMYKHSEGIQLLWLKTTNNAALVLLNCFPSCTVKWVIIGRNSFKLFQLCKELQPLRCSQKFPGNSWHSQAATYKGFLVWPQSSDQGLNQCTSRDQAPSRVSRDSLNPFPFYELLPEASDLHLSILNVNGQIPNSVDSQSLFISLSCVKFKASGISSAFDEPHVLINIRSVGKLK